MVIDYYQGNICGLQLASCTTQLFEIRNDLAGGVLKKQGMWLFIIACEIIESMTLYIALARDYTYIGGRRGGV